MSSTMTAVFTARTPEGTSVAFTDPLARDHAVALGLVTPTAEGAVWTRQLEAAKAAFNDRIVHFPNRPLLEALVD